MGVAWGQLDDNGELNFPCHPKQHAAVMSDVRFTAACAGTGGGKTACGPLWMLRRIQLFLDSGNPEPYLAFVVAPTAKIMRRATRPEFIKIFKSSHLRGRAIQPCYYLPNNIGIIHFLSANDPDGMVGGQVHDVWLDEGGQCKGEVWEELTQRTGVHEGHIFVTSTPYRINWFKTELIDKALAGDPDYAAYTWRSCDNPAYPMREYLAAKGRLPGPVWEMKYNAAFSSAEGRCYYGFDHTRTVRPVEYDPLLPMIVGSDFNVDPMAWVLGHIRNGALEIFDEIFIHNTNTPQTLDYLHEKYADHHGGFVFYGDASGKQRKTSATQSDYLHIANDERFKKLGRQIKYPDSNPHIIDRIETVNGKLKAADGSRSLFVDPSCENLIREFEQTYFKPGTREVHKTPEGPHLTDALGYITHGLWPLRIKQDNSGLRIIIRKGANAREGSNANRN